MSDAEHERTLGFLDPEFRETLESHWKTLDDAQDLEDQMMSATLDSCNRRAIEQKSGKTSIKQKLNDMIDRILGVPKD